jgi:hypothetical protein
MLMAAKKPTISKSGKRMGRPPTVNVVRRSTINLDEDDARRVDAYRAHVEKILPKSRLTEPQLLAQLLLKGLEAFEREEQPHPELPLKESSTTKSK